MDALTLNQILIRRSVKSSNFVFKGSSLVIYLTRSLCTSAINYKSHDQNSYRIMYKVFLVKTYEVLMVDYVLEELTTGLQYTQAISAREGFQAPPTELSRFKPSSGAIF